MIKFFRKIRQKMLTENKFSKYLLYAVGEIILVVIGILIALSINNWSNDKELRHREQVYLLSLQNEFQTNLNKINEIISENKNLMNDIEQMLTLFDNNVLDTISDKEISDIMYSIFGNTVSYRPSKGVLTDIISSGNLNLIQNEQLRQHLASFDSTSDIFEFQENGINSAKEEMIRLLNINGSIRKLLVHRGLNFEHQSISDAVNNKNLFSLTEFENNLMNYYLSIRGANGSKVFGGIKEEIELILIDLDSEIEKYDNAKIVNIVNSNINNIGIEFLNKLSNFRDSVDSIMQMERFAMTPMLMDFCEIENNKTKAIDILNWFEKYKKSTDKEFSQDTLKEINLRKERLKSGYNTELS